jgi:lipopolysaccharide/colanic/teichoic acid biosynthesis glycosyltransferase
MTLLNRIYRHFGKRMLDIIVSLALLILFSPVILLIMGIQRFVGIGGIFFSQRRPGYKERAFVMLKFKTMADTYDENGRLLPDVHRLTPWGNFLRKTSLDELPQLVNILRGNMSLVGPRPLLIEYLPLYDTRQRRRHLVKPGITGWAQVNGRNAITWEQKFELDVWYTEHVSFWLDLRIMMITLKKIFTAEDINHTGHATMPVFKGKPKTDEAQPQ